MPSFYTRWKNIEFLEGGLLKLIPNIKSGALRTTTSITRNMLNWKKEFLHMFISKILFIDTEQFSKTNIFSHVFFKDFVDGFGATFLKNEILWSCFSQVLLIDFGKATNLTPGSSKKYSCEVFFVDSKTSTKKSFKGTLTKNTAKRRF